MNWSIRYAADKIKLMMRCPNKECDCHFMDEETVKPDHKITSDIQKFVSPGTTLFNKIELRNSLRDSYEKLMNIHDLLSKKRADEAREDLAYDGDLSDSNPNLVSAVHHRSVAAECRSILDNLNILFKVQ